MRAKPSDRLGRIGIARIALGALALAAAGALPGVALANETVPATAEESKVAELERAFWACDYIATTQGVSAAPIAACKLATEALKQHKFGGNFEEMLNWWRTNKAAEHLKLDRLKKIEATA